MKNIVTILGINEIIDHYDIFILDQWGVMHDGLKGYDHAIYSVNQLVDKNNVLVTNKYVL